MTSTARWAAVGVPAAVLLLSAILRLWGIGTPPAFYWDEEYYVIDAAAYLGGGVAQPIEPAPQVRIADERTWVHPPLGKWLTALLGVGPVGDTPLGWRLPSAIAGVVGVGLLYLLALRLWGSVWWAGLAAGLLALDGLHVVQSRIAMLDVFLCAFVIAGFLFLVLDRERSRGPRVERWARTQRWCGTPYRCWAGVMFGAAIATKWSGVFAWAFGVGLCVAWLRRPVGSRRTTLAAVGTRIAVPLVIVPGATYVLAYGSFFVQHGPAVAAFLSLQLDMVRYHLDHSGVQPENSAPWTWPLLLHPIEYYRATGPDTARRIITIGNPVLWWGFLLCLPVAALTVARRPTWRDAVAFGGYAAMFVPWLLVPRGRFFYYMTPAVPFMALCIVATLQRFPERSARALGAGLALATAEAAVLFAPVWIGKPISPGWIEGLSWLPGWGP